MSNVDIVKQCYAAAERGDTEQLNKLLADDFEWVHQSAQETLDKAQIIEQAQQLRKGIPDLSFNPSNLRDGEKVKGTLRITGTHKGPLHIPPFTESPVEPTNKRIELPEEPTTWTVRNGQVARQETEAVEGGGPEALLRQVGAPVSKTH